MSLPCQKVLLLTRQGLMASPPVTWFGVVVSSYRSHTDVKLDLPHTHGRRVESEDSTETAPPLILLVTLTQNQPDGASVRGRSACHA